MNVVAAFVLLLLAIGYLTLTSHLRSQRRSIVRSERIKKSLHLHVHLQNADGVAEAQEIAF